MTTASHNLHAGLSRGIIGRSLIACAAALAVLVTTQTVSVAAQPATGQRGQTPAQGTGMWRDNCWYVFQGGGWQPQDLCRVMRGRSIYETYRPSTRVWMSRIDESVPGWTMTKALNDPNALWFRYRTSTGTNLEMLVNNRWVDAAAYMQQQAAAAPRAQPQRAGMPSYCPPFQGPLMAPNVRQSIPTNGDCTTPEEKAWQRGQIADLQNGVAIGHMRKNCENARAAHPYVSQRVGPDGVMLYRLNDGSEHRQGGTLNPGWIWTATGPQRTAC